MTELEYARQVSVELVRQNAGQYKHPGGSWTPAPLRIEIISQAALELMYRRQPRDPENAVHEWLDWGTHDGWVDDIEGFRENLSVGEGGEE